MSLPSPSFSFALKPTEAIKTLQDKGYKISFNYQEVAKEMHNTSFTAAKAMRADILYDLHTTITSAMESGIGFEEWKKNIIPDLEKKGWWGEKDIVNPSTGEVKTITIGGNRLRTIFKTNTLVARSTARYRQQMESDLPYMQYIGGLSHHPRSSHLAKNGIILPKEDPWWGKNYPINAWGCHCEVRTWSERQVKNRGWSVSSTPSEDIATPDWAYNPGWGSNVGKIKKIDLDGSIGILPTVLPKREYKELSSEELKKKFYADLEVKKGDLFIDKIGDPMSIDENLFVGNGGYDKLKDKKRVGRELFVDEFAKTIANPDEIYIAFDKKREKLVKKLFRYFKSEGGGKRATMALFEYNEDKTQGVTFYYIDGGSTLEQKRSGKLMYKRAD